MAASGKQWFVFIIFVITASYFWINILTHVDRSKKNSSNSHYIVPVWCNQEDNKCSKFIRRRNILNDTCQKLLMNIHFYKRYKQLLSSYYKTMNASTCTIYNADSILEKFYISSIWNNELSFDPHSITLVSQLTLNRFHLIELLMKHWEGPISLSLYIDIDEISVVFDKFLSSISILESDKIDFHFVVGTAVSYSI